MNCYLCAHPRYATAVMGQAKVPLCQYCANMLAIETLKREEEEIERKHIVMVRLGR